MSRPSKSPFLFVVNAWAKDSCDLKTQKIIDMTDFEMIELGRKEQEAKQLALANVINWVAVKSTNPPENEYETYFITDEMGFMYERNWKGHFWEGEHIVGEPKVTHWTIVKPPCL